MVKSNSGFGTKIFLRKEMELSDSQKSVLFQLVDGARHRNKIKQTLGGYAGVGKTVIVKYLKKFLPNFAVCAYTGKATNVLRKKGVMDASTIHSLIYTPHFDQGFVYFDLAESLSCEGFLVDEASMVSEEIYHDVASFGLPMIFVGDHGQLEPINSDFNLMRNPDYRLEEIHRNAGNIAKFAEHLRKGLAARGFDGKGKVRFVVEENLDDLLAVNQVICAYNKTRVRINQQMREAMGFDGVINIGERVMCLRNNKRQGLFNGMQGTVVALREGKYRRKHMDFEFDGQFYENIWYSQRTFGEEKPKIDHSKDSPNPFDYAYCITCHKAQGDEWPKVMVIEQKCKGWNHRRWAYTSASRAKEEVIWRLNG